MILTEAQLSTLIKKIIREQVDSTSITSKPTSSSGAKLPTPIQIKILLSTKKGEETYLVSFDKVKQVKDGCEFEGTFRGDTKRHTFMYKCDGTLYWKQGMLSSNTEVEISAEAAKLLAKACGCDVYASNKPASGMQSQMAENNGSVTKSISFESIEEFMYNEYSKKNNKNISVNLTFDGRQVLANINGSKVPVKR